MSQYLLEDGHPETAFGMPPNSVITQAQHGLFDGGGGI